MVRRLTLDSIHQHHGGCLHFVNVPVVAIALFVSVTALVALCAKHTIRRRQIATEKLGCNPNDSRLKTGSPSMVASKGLFATISNKAFPFMYKKKSGEDAGSLDDGSLWQRGILMGEKCQPPDFSGVIYYDVDGRRLSEIPRSPRASPFPSSFSFPATKDGNF
ncbi:hypothetical protein MKX01_038829 [Papaver californicum]|nr:hypothetical protein MKX01_038829 [Papaver californicum]